MVQDTRVLTCSAWPNWEPNCSKCSRRIKPSESSSHTSNTSLSFLTSVSRCPGSGIKSSSISLLLYSSIGCFSSKWLACGTMLFGNSLVGLRACDTRARVVHPARARGGGDAADGQRSRKYTSTAVYRSPHFLHFTLSFWSLFFFNKINKTDQESSCANSSMLACSKCCY